ncbi:unnamed protein product [Candida verbasci]|uniref:BHLH domain-containing protein n=1 Tax=Candida verbasci TaxID=1227364 RepID=A0A9W4TZ51_9ASCO|nr:unnamed protein product [Candida verbasci]
MSYKINNNYNAFINSLFDKNGNYQQQNPDIEHGIELENSPQVNSMNLENNQCPSLISPSSTKTSLSNHELINNDLQKQQILNNGVIQPEFDLNLALQFQPYQNNEFVKSKSLNGSFQDGNLPNSVEIEQPIIYNENLDQFLHNTTPLASPLSINQQNFIKQEEVGSVLNFNDPKQLTSQAANIQFNNSSPPVSPLTTTDKPPTRLIRKKSSKLSDEVGNPINHNPHPGRPRIKSAHNVIEQRYRNKINDKFNSLQDSVPTLRILATKKLKEKLLMKQQNQEDGSINYDDSSDEDLDYQMNGIDINQLDENIDLEGLEPARKLNKGTILAKSIEYIKHLELKNYRMKKEHDDLIMKAKLLGMKIDKQLE